MSMFESMMRQGGAPTLMAGIGEKAAIIYTTPSGETIECDAIIDSEKGGLNNNFDTGDVEKVIRQTVTVLVEQLSKKGVDGLERFATVTIGEKQWAMDLQNSSWGQSFVKLGLIRREITRHGEMEANGSVR